MSESEQLVATLKSELRARGLTYRDVAVALELSEASVKRLFASGNFTLDRLAALARLLGYSLAELTARAAARTPRLQVLSEAQERELVSDIRLLLVAVCAVNQWTLAEMVASFRLSEAEGIQYLLRLERLRLLALMPGNRIRLTVARDFDWLPNGPIRAYFRLQGQDEFLDHTFTGPGEELMFVHGMLSSAQVADLLAEVRALRRKFGQLHDASAALPLGERHGGGLLLAYRPWEPRAFAALRRHPPAA
jgi:hypothetical protein